MWINRKNDTELQRGQKTCTSLWLVNFHKFRVTYTCGCIDNIIFNCPRIGEKWSSECCRAGVMMQYFHAPWMEISISVSFNWKFIKRVYDILQGRGGQFVSAQKIQLIFLKPSLLPFYIFCFPLKSNQHKPPLLLIRDTCAHLSHDYGHSLDA